MYAEWKGQLNGMALYFLNSIALLKIGRLLSLAYDDFIGVQLSSLDVN